MLESLPERGPEIENGDIDQPMFPRVVVNDVEITLEEIFEEGESGAIGRHSSK